MVDKLLFMKIHKEGHKIILTTFIFLVVFNTVLFFIFPEVMTLRYVAGLLSLVTFIGVVSFFRLPFLEILESKNDIILAPADGKIVVIEEVHEPEYFDDKRIQVSIFMSPANVHVNRLPISGKVEYTKYHPGNYLVAWHPKSSTQNERFTSVIKDEDSEIEVLVRQIAGKIARKISNYLEEGEEVLQGKELGFIKFGSRVDLFLPLNAKIEVNLKEKVKGGKTVLARLS